MKGLNNFFKRCFDLLFAGLFLIIFSPIYIITFLIIKIVSPGPALYVAKRVGKNGKIFGCYKFRSMRVDSGKVRLTTLKYDERIFPFGHFIRNCKIDEFPQIFNILNGSMTIVGPRPEDEGNAERIYQGKYKSILTVKPGLTSTGSLYDYTHGEMYEDEASYEKNFLPEKLKLELYYVQHQSFVYDIRLILRTAKLIVLKSFGKIEFKKPKELLEI